MVSGVLVGFFVGLLVGKTGKDDTEHTLGFAEGFNAGVAANAPSDIVAKIERPGGLLVQRRDGSWWVKYDLSPDFDRVGFSD